MRASDSSERSANPLDRFRDAGRARVLLEKLRSRRVRATVMEVCGTHTVAMFRSGIRTALPEGLRCISGPGCPVCVTPPEVVETAITLARRRRTILFTFGDMARVPGAGGSLENARAEGAGFKIMYGPAEALDYAREHTDTDIVLLGIGFETTIPLFASILIRARDERLENLYLLAAFRLIPPALDAILSGECAVDGFLLPGHVSVIIGEEAYAFLPEKYRVSGVVTGFEPVDILEGLLLLLDMIESGKPAIMNAYGRFVRREGNRRARDLAASVFTRCDARWRGFGEIPSSGLKLRDEFARFDAYRLLDRKISPIPEPEGCLCGEVIRGRRIPPECALFRSRCTPSTPIGPCMVSSEGVCAAHFKYCDLVIG